MRTALTILAVAVGKLLCRLGLHRWGPWWPTKRVTSYAYWFKKSYKDTQWERRKDIREWTGRERFCRRCGKSELYIDTPPVWERPHGIYDAGTVNEFGEDIR